MLEIPIIPAIRVPEPINAIIKYNASIMIPKNLFASAMFLTESAL